MTNKILRFRLVSFQDAKKKPVPKLVLYVKKLIQVSSPSTSLISLEEKDPQSSVVLACNETFDLFKDDDYFQILFLESKSDKPIADLVLRREDVVQQYITDPQYKENTFPEQKQSRVVEEYYTFHFTVQLVNGSHRMETHHFNEPVSCAICRKFMWGVYRQGYECSQCLLVTHRKCRHMIPFDCLKSPQKVAQIQNPKPHEFVVQRARLLQSFISGDKNYCNHCGSQVFHHALKCSQCPFIIHKHCQPYIPPMCGIPYNSVPPIDSITENSGIISRESPPSPPRPPSPPNTSLIPKFSDFKCIGEIGNGAYGNVYCVQHMPSKNFLAMKIIDGSIDDARHQIEMEKHILYKYGEGNPYMIRGYCSFHCGKNLFLGMEFVDGETLRVKIQRKQMNEEEIGFYLAEIISVLEYLHSKQIIYRDLKLDHIIINSAGHIRLIDFGLGRILGTPNERRLTICGTPGGIAPDIVKVDQNPTNEGYSYAVDYWCLGLIFGQMLCHADDMFRFQFSPDTSPESMAKEVIDEIKKLPKDVSEEARSCLFGLLEINPEKRLGSKTSPYGLIQDHTFFSTRSKIDWEQIDEGSYKSKYKNRIKTMNISLDMPFANLTLHRGDYVQEEWTKAGKSKCTSNEEKQYKSFDSINESTWFDL